MPKVQGTDISPTAAHLGQHLADWRRMRSLSQETAAERAGVSRSTLSRMERGDSSVSVDTLLRVATVYGIATLMVSAVNPLNTAEGPEILLSTLRSRIHDTP